MTDHNIDAFLPTRYLDLSNALHLSDEALRKGVQQGCDLLTLSLYKASSFTPGAVCDFVGRQTNLQELTLSRAGCASDELLHVLSAHCTKLTSLNLVLACCCARRSHPRCLKTRQSTLSPASLMRLKTLVHLQVRCLLPSRSH